ncbi:MAG TPA: EAL domain-containing protein [Acidimicrobiia bacterium]|nr:EAL domain-containing protein [Acidimicrobiia bacterium]
MTIERDWESSAADVASSLERIDDLARLWRVATFEYDLAQDVVYWFDDPTPALNLSEDRAAALLEPIRLPVRGATPWAHYDLDQRVDDLDGDPIHVRVQARLLHGPDGAVTGFVGIAADVTEQRRTEQTLRGIVDRYRRLVEMNPDPIVVHQQGVVRYVNPATLEMAGINKPDEWVGRQLHEFIHPTSLEETVNRIAQLTEPGMVSAPAEVHLIAPDGTTKPYESISVCTEWDGRPAHQVILRSIAERRRAETALRYQASLIAHVSDAVVAADLDGNIRGWNRAAEDFYGYRAVEVIGEPVRTVLGPDAVTATGTTRSGRVAHQRADRGTVSVQVSVSPLRDDLGEPSGTVAVCADLTERLEREAAEARYSAVVAALDEGVMVVDRDDTVVSVNEAALAQTGAGIEVGSSCRQLLEAWPMMTEHGTSLAPDQHPVAVALRECTPQNRVVIGVATDSGIRWFSVSAQPITVEDTLNDAVVCSFSDITSRKQAEEELSFQATHDPLTRLPNRDLVLGSLLRATEHGVDAGAALLLIDLDGFKTVNDTFGHGVGDRVIQEVAVRITNSVGSGGVVGRLAGDEFVVACWTSDPDAARSIADRVLAAIRAPVQLPSGREVVVTASIGIARHTTATSRPDLVLSYADVAMYRAKENGRACVEFFDETMRSSMSRRVLLHEGLRQAIDANELTIDYQPIVTATDLTIVGVEALARWEHQTLGEINPSEFIPIAEQSGLITELGKQILHLACEDMARWTRRQFVRPDLTLSVNLSPLQLHDPGLVGAIATILEDSGLEPDRLWLEVTETVLMDDTDESTVALGELRAAGVHIAIDDFGTGYSSLTYLKRFPAEALKIDASFVAGLGSDPESEAIVAAIVGLAKALHLGTIAEGVETPRHLEYLRDLGCDLLQGHLLSPPKPTGWWQIGPPAAPAR